MKRSSTSSIHMFNQHAKWLDASTDIPWRQPISSLNYLLTSHVWHQEHNGFSHQDPGFIDVALNKKADVVRVYLPPDANTLLCVTDHVLRTWDRINIIVAGKPPLWQWLSLEEARVHCKAGLGIWHWASNEDGLEPDVVMVCAGDVPTLETLAAVSILREYMPKLRVRVVNVVDLMALQPQERHPHGTRRRRFRCDFHQGQARHLLLSRVSMDHPSPDLPKDQSRQLPCARIQRRRNDDDTVRHDGVERPRQVQSGLECS